MSDVRALCRADYQEYVAMAQIPRELKDALKTHERVPVFVDNLAREIKAIERVRVGKRLDRMTIKKMVYDLTEMYIGAVKRQADERMMSEVARHQAIQDQTNLQLMRDAADLLTQHEVTTVEQTPQGEITRTTVKI